jgi:hypothetical protein
MCSAGGIDNNVARLYQELLSTSSHSSLPANDDINLLVAVTVRMPSNRGAGRKLGQIDEIESSKPPDLSHSGGSYSSFAIMCNDILEELVPKGKEVAFTLHGRPYVHALCAQVSLLSYCLLLAKAANFSIDISRISALTRRGDRRNDAVPIEVGTTRLSAPARCATA